jgi:hypothetical protein
MKSTTWRDGYGGVDLYYIILVIWILSGASGKVGMPPLFVVPLFYSF